VTKRNHTAKSSKQEVCEKVETERFTRNRFIPLTVTPNDAVDTDGTIPALVNGVIALKGRERKTNISTSQKKNIEHSESNHKMTNDKINVSKEQATQQRPNNSQRERKHKIMIVGDSHARGSASNIKHNLNNDFDLNGFVKPGAD